MPETSSAVDETLRRAIAERRLVQFQYGPGARVAEPHDYGVQGGRVRLLVYQLRGASSTRLPGWRLLDVSRMSRVVLLAEGFRGSRGGAHRLHKVWDELFARVE